MKSLSIYSSAVPFESRRYFVEFAIYARVARESIIIINGRILKLNVVGPFTIVGQTKSLLSVTIGQLNQSIWH